MFKGFVYALVLSIAIPAWALTPIEVTKLLANDAAADDVFGWDVAIDGNTAIIGAIGDDDNGSSSGSAYVFTRSGTVWTQQAKLTASDAAAISDFGHSVAIHGDTALIGARGALVNGIHTGAAYVFTRSGTVWTQQAKLTASDAAEGHQFGFSVELKGDTALIAAPADTHAGAFSGSAYVFTRSGTVWTQQAKLTASDAEGGDLFGFHMALDGDTALVSSRQDDDNGDSSGSVYVFTRSGTVWTQQAKLTASDAAEGDQFGDSVALDNDTAVIGATGDDDGGNGSGAAYVFTRSGTVWTQQAKLTASDAAVSDGLGFSVAIEGNTVVTGARLATHDGKALSGSAYVFTRSGTVWTQQAKLTASDAADFDFFGTSVAISGDTVLISSVLNDDNGSNSGSVYVFSLDLNTPPTANAGGPYFVNEGGALQLNAGASSGPDGNALTYQWDFNYNGMTFDVDATGIAPIFSAAGLDGPLTRTVAVRVSDGSLSSIATAQVNVLNVAPTATFGNNGPVNEGSSINLSLSYASDVSSDSAAGFQYAIDCGSGYGAYSGTSTAICSTNDNGTRAVKGKIRDKDGGEREYTANLSVNNLTPVVGAIAAPIDPVAVNSSINASASFIDGGTADTHSAQWDWGNGITPGTVIQGSGSGSVSDSRSYATPGIYTAKLTVTDDDGGAGTSEFKYVVVYDPNGSFVTGGGWINSPAGAYVADATLTGKANFGFVSKYKQGANVPTGTTEFQFNAGNLNFRSASYEWLVVAGARAQFKGVGTINGAGNYGFLLFAIDGQVGGGGGADKFRIKIWDKNNSDAIVYDNELGLLDDADPTTVLGGGSIVIHK